MESGTNRFVMHKKTVKLVLGRSLSQPNRPLSKQLSQEDEQLLEAAQVGKVYASVVSLTYHTKCKHCPVCYNNNMQSDRSLLANT